MDSYIKNNTKNSSIKIDLQATINDISESLKSSLMFVGAKNIEEFHSKIDFIKKY
jgi:isopentenyl diphosphate isomerase/L-lactate dehydrogenase-like FMN-dependent dehydrogenase